jgi:hypothetical protein
MGHKDDNTFLSYVSRISDIDSVAIMHDKPQRQKLFEYLRSMAMSRNIAPVPPELEACLTTQEINKLKDRSVLEQLQEVFEERIVSDQWPAETQRSLEVDNVDPFELPAANDVITLAPRPTLSGAVSNMHDSKRRVVAELFFADTIRHVPIEEAARKLAAICVDKAQEWYYVDTLPAGIDVSDDTAESNGLFVSESVAHQSQTAPSHAQKQLSRPYCKKALEKYAICAPYRKREKEG